MAERKVELMTVGKNQVIGIGWCMFDHQCGVCSDHRRDFSARKTIGGCIDPRDFKVRQGRYNIDQSTSNMTRAVYPEWAGRGRGHHLCFFPQQAH